LRALLRKRGIAIGIYIPRNPVEISQGMPGMARVFAVPKLRATSVLMGKERSAVAGTI